MQWKMKALSSDTVSLLEACSQQHSPMAAALFLLREMLKPSGGDPSLNYRYEHSLRAAGWGMRIARGEGWDEEPLTLACLLHDIGYPECFTEEDFHHHQCVSAHIAGIFLEKIGYAHALREPICRAIQLHNLWDEVPDDASPFELSVRDSDDLDRFDVLRTYRTGGSILGSAFICDRSAMDIIESCKSQIHSIDQAREHLCATATAQKLWETQISQRRDYFQALIRQMEATQSVEVHLKNLK